MNRAFLLPLAAALLLLAAAPASARAPRWGGLDAVAVSPDGKSLAVGGQNRTLYLLDPVTLEVRRRVWVGGRIVFLAFNRDGSRLLLEDDSESLRLFDAATWKLLERVPRCSGAVISRAADLVAVRDRSSYPEARLRLLSLTDVKEKGTVELTERAAAYAFDAEGKKLVMVSEGRAGAEKKLPLSEPSPKLSELGRREFRQRHDGMVSSLLTVEVAKGKVLRAVPLWYTSDSDSTQLAVAGGKVWVTNFNNTCARIEASGATALFETGLTFNHALAVSPDGKLLACGGMREGLYGPLEGGKRVKFELEALPGWPEYFGGFAFAPDGIAYGVTSAFRVVRIDKAGKVVKVAAVF